MSNNLTSKQILTWKNQTSQYVSKGLWTILEQMRTTVSQLKVLTQSVSDENDLSYRYNDLHNLLLKSENQLSTFMNAFNNSLETYVKEVKAAESEAVEATRRDIDQFAEKASEIAKLKM